MKVPFALLSLLLLLGFQLGAQSINLVGNGTFENLAGYPSGQGQLGRAVGWTNCNGNTTWPYGSPDLFNGYATGNVQLPNTVAGTVSALEGTGIGGFITSNGLVSDFREYLSYHLDAPMIPGQVYTVEFWLTNGMANWYGNRGSDGIGAAFTMTQPSQVQHEVIALVPQVEITSITHHTDWRRYSFAFTPTQAYQYITIGNFRDDVATHYATFTTGTDIAYYFIDMVSVIQSTPLSAAAADLHQIENPKGIDLGWHVPSDAAGNGFVLERSLDQQRFEDVHDFGSDLVPDADVQYSDVQALAGLVYYYRLREQGHNGELRYSPLVEATFGKATTFVAGEVYPNPVQDHFALSFTAEVSGLLDLAVYDGNGRLVMAAQRSLEVGDDDPSFEWPAGLAAGIYQAKFQFGQQAFTKKLLVVGRQ